MSDPNPDLGRRAIDEGLLSKDELLKPLATAPAIETPRRLGRYDIVRLLGKGAAGEVWLARDPSVGRDVAIKVLRGADFDQRFTREVQILGALRHPNIVALHDAGEESGLRYFVMERIEGRTLAQAGDLPLRQRVAILRHVALACHAAHERGVIHRDLKPSNILLDAHGKPYVTDFGVAKVLRAEERMTLTGTAVGTPYYMSPEQAEGKVDLLDRRSDVYALGVMLYEALTGAVPFDGKTFFEISRQIVEEEPRRPTSVNAAVPRDLEAVALKAMEKKREARYPNAVAFANELARWLDGQPVRASRPGIVTRMTRWFRRRPAIAVFAAACVVLLVVLAVTQARVAAANRRARANADRLEAARKRVDDQLQRIRDWDVNLYKPAATISFDDLARAIAALEDVLKSGEQVPAAHYGIARARMRMGRADLAMADLERAIASAPPDKAGLWRLERARATWDTLLREAVAKNEAAVKRLRDQVHDDVRSAVSLGLSDTWDADFAQAVLLMLEGEKNVDRAVESCRRLAGVKGKPGEEALKLLGDVALLREDAAGALTSYAEALKVRQSYVQAKAAESMAYLSKEDVMKALLCAREAAEMNPSYAETYHVFAVVCRGVLRQDPKEWTRDPQAYLDFVKLIVPLFERGRQARPDLAVIELALGAAHMVRQTALLKRDKKPSDEAHADAVAAFERFIKAEPRTVDGYIGLGLTYGIHGSIQRETGKGDPRSSLLRSVDALKKATEVDAKCADGWRWLGSVQQVLSEWQPAIDAWTRAIELDESLRETLEPEIAKARQGRR